MPSKLTSLQAALEEMADLALANERSRELARARVFLSGRWDGDASGQGGAA